MQTDFRASMAWLHTWAGVILGSLMFVMFFFGTLSVFKLEIDQWMLPQSRVALPEAQISVDRVYDAIEDQIGPNARHIRIVLPSKAFPAIYIQATPAEGPVQRLLMDPASYEFLPPQDSAAARNFLYPMHYRLTPMPYGRWVSAAIAMLMLAMFFSGIVIHRKIFVDFFTFRPGKKLPRSSLDLHNLTSVLAMPFHILITITGVLILFGLYFEPSLKSAYNDDSGRQEIRHDLEGTQAFVSRDAVNPNRIVSLDGLIQRAEPFWDGAEAADIQIFSPGDMGGAITLYKSVADQVSSFNQPVQFRAATGELQSYPVRSAAYATQLWLAGVHLIFFDYWVLRWLYFFAGLAGCTMIATGFIYWMETRRKIYKRNKWPGVRIVEGFAVWGVMGAMTATAAFLAANRALAPGLWTWNGIPKFGLELLIFYIVWLLCMIHGFVRGKAAWAEQAWLLGGLGIAAVVLNWTSTGDHLFETLTQGRLAIAGMDLVLVAGAVVSITAALKIACVRRQTPK